jgi:tetratricopeptide (TPR) repeat protein
MMLRVTAGGGRLVTVLAVLATLVLSLPAFAQSTGLVKGKVVDAQEKVVEGATVTIEYTDGVSRKYEVRTNKKGEYIQIGLQPGNYRITAQKEKVGVQAFDVRVRLGSTSEVNFTLTPQGAAPMSKEEAAQLEAFKKVFDAGIAANNAGNYDEAIARFNEAVAMRPDCFACQYNLGSAYARKQEYEKSEAAFKKAIELKPDQPDGYNALAELYNAQKRFDDAAKMMEEATKRASAGGASATGGGDANALFNQGVIFWNAGKIAEAKKQFEAALQANPGHAEAHYWVGMASLNEGKVPEAVQHFEEYLKLEPTGQYAEQAKGVVSQLKK